MDDTYTLRLLNQATDKVIKDLPKRNTDKEKREEAQTKLLIMQENIRSAVRSKVQLLERQFCNGCGTKTVLWESVYLHHAALRILAKKVVWEQDIDGQKTSFAYTGEDFVKADGSPFKLEGGGTIRVAHPAEMEEQELGAWRRYLERKRLTQPFNQLWAPYIRVDVDSLLGIFGALNGPNENLERISTDILNMRMVEKTYLTGTIEIEYRHGVFRALHSWSRDWNSEQIQSKFEMVSAQDLSLRSTSQILLDIIKQRSFIRAVISRGDSRLAILLDHLSKDQLQEYLDFAVAEGIPEVVALLLDHLNRIGEGFKGMDEFALTTSS